MGGCMGRWHGACVEMLVRPVPNAISGRQLPKDLRRNATEFATSNLSIYITFVSLVTSIVQQP